MSTLDTKANDHLSREELFEKVTAFFKDSPALTSVTLPFHGMMLTFKRADDTEWGWSFCIPAVPLPDNPTGKPTG